MTTLTVKISGDKQLMRALDGDLRKANRRGGILIAAEIRRELVEYPPLSAANVPKRFVSKGDNRWYERGYGPRWALKRGGVGGSPSSEMLNRSWMIGQKGRANVFLASLASYSPVVHHYKEQASFHKRRGWITDKQAVDRVRKSGKMDRIMNAVIKRILKG